MLFPHVVVVGEQTESAESTVLKDCCFWRTRGLSRTTLTLLSLRPAFKMLNGAKRIPGFQELGPSSNLSSSVSVIVSFLTDPQKSIWIIQLF